MYIKWENQIFKEWGILSGQSALQLMWWKVTFVFILLKIPTTSPSNPLFKGSFAICQPQVEFVSFPFWPILVSSLFLSGSIISSDRKKRTYFILVHLPVFVRWFYVWVLYNFPVIFIKWHLLDICVCLYLLPVPKTSGFVALYHWKMFMLVMLTLPPFYHWFWCYDAVVVVYGYLQFCSKT